MLKNRFVFMAAFVGLLGLGACGGDNDVEPEPEVVEQVSAPAEAEVLPEVYEGSTVMDTSMAGTVVDTPATRR